MTLILLKFLITLIGSLCDSARQFLQGAPEEPFVIMLQLSKARYPTLDHAMARVLLWLQDEKDLIEGEASVISLEEIRTVLNTSLYQPKAQRQIVLAIELSPEAKIRLFA